MNNIITYNTNIKNKQISILPNPTSCIITVSYNQVLPFVVEVTNTIGENIYRSKFSSSTAELT